MYSIATNQEQVDYGLRAYMLGIYNKMTLALIVSALVAWFSTSFMLPIMTSIVGGLIFSFLPLAFVIALMFMNRMPIQVAHTLFWAYAVSMGLSLSTIFQIYALDGIVKTLFISTSVFAAASIYGYTTNRNLTSLGAFLFMGVVGILVASIVNLFLASSMLAWIISVVAVLAFTGLTAYDTQRLKDEYYSRGEVFGFDSPEKSTIYGALILYIDFINIFIHLLQLLSGKKE